MKVFAINGSPKSDGNTAYAMKTVLCEIADAGIVTELVTIGGELIGGCLSCGGCVRKQNRRCVIDDKVNECLPAMIAADGILVGSPVYYSGLNGVIKSFLDRAFYVASVNGNLFRHKVGAAVAAVRRSGGINTFDQLNKYFQISEMLVVSSNYWNVIHGAAKNEAEKDNEGVQIMQLLGKNFAWLLKTLEYAKPQIPPPNITQKIKTNFIR
ncbi:MAG: flavodoxin family protein [Planctomycetaceae bacterium]|jgi:multimeric flavodoxin WrbA|nr:flavodoxin family protein [Planctomycetaceae bacterium]